MSDAISSPQRCSLGWTLLFWWRGPRGEAGAARGPVPRSEPSTSPSQHRPSALDPAPRCAPVQGAAWKDALPSVSLPRDLGSTVPGVPSLSLLPAVPGSCSLDGQGVCKPIPSLPALSSRWKEAEFEHEFTCIGFVTSFCLADSSALCLSPALALGPDFNRAKGGAPSSGKSRAQSPDSVLHLQGPGSRLLPFHHRSPATPITGGRCSLRPFPRLLIEPTSAGASQEGDSPLFR